VPEALVAALPELLQAEEVLLQAVRRAQLGVEQVGSIPAGITRPTRNNPVAGNIPGGSGFSRAGGFDFVPFVHFEFPPGQDDFFTAGHAELIGWGPGLVSKPHATAVVSVTREAPQ
jgi:hypothetical protein